MALFRVELIGRIEIHFLSHISYVRIYNQSSRFVDLFDENLNYTFTLQKISSKDVNIN